MRRQGSFGFNVSHVTTPLVARSIGGHLSAGTGRASDAHWEINTGETPISRLSREAAPRPAPERYVFRSIASNLALRESIVNSETRMYVFRVLLSNPAHERH